MWKTAWGVREFESRTREERSMTGLEVFDTTVHNRWHVLS